MNNAGNDYGPMNQKPTPPSRWRSPLGIFMLVAGAVGIYYLLTEHLTHVGQAIPYLILLACPLMHLFGHHHGGHGSHGGGHGSHLQVDEKDKQG